MYCSHCGTEIEGRTQFCQVCGQPLNSQELAVDGADSGFSHEMTAGRQRESVVKYLDMFRAHVASQVANYNDLESRSKEIDRIEKLRDQEKERLNNLSPISGIVALAIGVALIVAFFNFYNECAQAGAIPTIDNPTSSDYLELAESLLFLFGPALLGLGLIAKFFIARACIPKKIVKMDLQIDRKKSLMGKRRRRSGLITSRFPIISWLRSSMQTPGCSMRCDALCPTARPIRSRRQFSILKMSAIARK